MPTVTVNGNLEEALAAFKRKTGEEGIVGEFKRRQQYFPPHELKARKEFRAECRRRRKAREKQ